MCNYRPDLPQPIPQRIQALPIERGMPAPWFSAVIDGHYDFRVSDGRKLAIATKKKLCWICGQKLGSYLAFPIGPMCALNRTIAEPPSHRGCAEWSIKACPFLNQDKDYRRETNLPEGRTMPGVALKRQPGAICLWITRSYKPFSDGKGGILFKIGEPEEVLWFRERHTATREEVLESIDSGYPILMEMATLDGPEAVKLLLQYRRRLEPLLPSEEAAA